MSILKYKNYLNDLDENGLKKELQSVNNIVNSQEEVKYKTSLILSMLHSDKKAA